MPEKIRNYVGLMKKPGFLCKALFKLSSLFMKNCKKAFHGSPYGGWTICPEEISPESLVYSIGVGEDASFDLSMIDTYGAKVFAFDPTPRSKTWVEKRTWPQKFKFFPLGIAAQTGKMVFHPPENPLHVSYTLLSRPETAENAIEVDVRCFSDLVKISDHTEIDILKMDIEGAEYQVIPDILNQKHIQISQILVEFHDHFPEINWKQSRRAIRQINKAGYKLFHISQSGYEYSFKKKK